MFSHKFEIEDKPKLRKVRELENIKSMMVCESDQDILKQYPNAEIVYILHEKFVINNPSDEAQREAGKEQIMNALHNVTWITYRSLLEKPLLTSN